jgi:hypothetical protein
MSIEVKEDATAMEDKEVEVEVEVEEDHREDNREGVVEAVIDKAPINLKVGKTRMRIMMMRKKRELTDLVITEV